MADYAVNFIECLCHTKGTWAGKPFELIDWQEQIIRDIFGTLKPNGYRQFNTAYVEIPKKMGKSELAAAVALLLTCGDGEERAEVYGCAADRQQATIVFDVAADMVRMCPALNRRVKILASQKRIVYQPTNSFYQVLSAEAYSKHGFNIHGVVFDELHTQPNRKLFDVMTKGSGDARMQPLYFLITTAGTDTNSICYETHQKAKDILEGRKIDPTFYPVIYGADEADDWTDPEVWKKANPSLGITVGIDKVEAACESAKQNPGEENSFRQLRLNQWVKQAVRWMPMEKWDSTLTTGFLNSSGTITFTATVTDSRGRTSAATTVSITVIAYSVPSFSSYNSQRCNSSGTISDDGTYIKATVSYSFASCSSKNTVTRSTYYRVAGTSTWTNASASFNSGTAFTFGSGKISTETSYEVKYELTDAFTTISITDIVSTASVVMDFKSGGKGVAVGKVSETDNCFEVSEKWDVKVYGKLLSEYVKQAIGAIYPVGSIYMSVKNTNPSTYFGGTWVAWGTGRVPVGVNANDTNFATVEKTGGASTVTLTAAQMPSHTHAKGTLATASAGGHTHDLKNQKTSWGTSGGNRVLIDATSGYTAVSNKTTTSAGSHSHTISGATAASGSGSAHNNLQPYITCYMWKRTA